jgi:mannose-6-phosphate isomerase-like protein (cupin superfamily)
MAPDLLRVSGFFLFFMQTKEFSTILRENTQPYFNTTLEMVNDHVVRLSRMTTPYPWHWHPNSDETFIGVEGVVIIETEQGVFELTPGASITIPRGMAHCTRPKGERSVNLTVERADMETVFITREQ